MMCLATTWSKPSWAACRCHIGQGVMLTAEAHAWHDQQSVKCEVTESLRRHMFFFKDARLRIRLHVQCNPGVLVYALVYVHPRILTKDVVHPCIIVYVNPCACLYILMCAPSCVSLCAHPCVYPYVCPCILVCIHPCICILVCILLCVPLCTPLYTCILASLCVCAMHFSACKIIFSHFDLWH